MNLIEEHEIATWKTEDRRAGLRPVSTRSHIDMSAATPWAKLYACSCPMRRQNKSRCGEGNGFAKLTEADVTEMRRSYWVSRALQVRPRVTIAELAKEYEVTYYCAYAAINSITWAHLPDPVIPTRCRSTRDMFEKPKQPIGSHCIKHRAEVVDLARWLASTTGWGDRTIGYLVNVPHSTVQNWREGRMRASA